MFPSPIRISGIKLLVLILSSLPRQTKALDFLWCYCTTCPENIRYCKLSNGTCFKERIFDNFHNYGCWNKSMSQIKCGLTGKECCHLHWCNINEYVMRVSRNNLIDAEEENLIDAREKCYCTVCGRKKVCSSDIGCYRDTSNSLTDPDYGCLSTNHNESFCQISFYGTIDNSFFNPQIQCCFQTKLCNVSPLNIPTDQLIKILNVKTVRFERKNVSQNSARYRVRIRNGIMGNFAVHIINLLGAVNDSIKIVDFRGFIFNFKYNLLYKISIKPLFEDDRIHATTTTFYLSRLLAFNTSWFPDSIYYSIMTPTIILCDNCIEGRSNYQCSDCISSIEQITNPIWWTK